MCGLSVIISPQNDIHRTEIELMNSEIIHRGPDAEGYFFSDHIAMGHRRLSIIDLSNSGNQPMNFLDRYVIVFNGEIYNYIELKEELKKFGAIFKTSTDTEVIVASYHYWGVSCLNRFNGMWAFCLFDKQENIAFISRDRWGIKPLYIKEVNKKIKFASEIKQLLIGNTKNTANLQTLMNYVVFGMTDLDNDTFFGDIQCFPPAHYMIVNVNSGQKLLNKYFDLKVNNDLRSLDTNSAVEGYHNLLQSSISLRLRSDVKVGTCLSGGLDSSYIASVASHLYRSKTGKCFTGITAGSINPINDESGWAEKIAQENYIDWHIIYPQSIDFYNNIDSIIKCQEEPFTTPSIFMQYFVMKKASETGSVVLLDGQGGDETLLGYERYFSTYLYNLSLFKKPNSIIKLAKNSKLSLYELPLMERYFTNFKLRRAVIIHNNINIKNKFVHLANWKYLKELVEASKNIDMLQIFELTKSCLPHLLKYEDRNSMHFSIETRLPFLDYRVVEYALSIDPEIKLQNGWSKFVMRSGSEQILPKEVRWRKQKIGFEAPNSIWLDDTDYFIKQIKNSSILNLIAKKQLSFKNSNILWRYYNLAKWEEIFNISI